MIFYARNPELYMQEVAERRRFKRPVDYCVDFVLDLCEQADPSSKKAFVIPILKWWLDGVKYNHNYPMRFLEDIAKAEEPLKIYMKFKNRFKREDVLALPFPLFWDKRDEAAQIPSGSEEDRAMQQSFFDSGQAQLVLDTPDVKIVIPKTEEAAKYFGRNTRWCTSAKNQNMFKRYNSSGPLYIILFKKENKRWQFHWPSGQFMNERDEDILFKIDPEMHKYPELRNWWDEIHRAILFPQVRETLSAIQKANAVLAMYEPTMSDWKEAIEKYPKVYQSIIMARGRSEHIPTPEEAQELHDFYNDLMQSMDSARRARLGK